MVNIKVNLKQVLENPGAYDGWLYLKVPPWKLDSEGFFYRADIDLLPEDEKKIRDEFVHSGWIATLSTEDIEDVVAFANDQVEKPSLKQYLDSFVYFFENDAYLEL